MTQQLVFLDTEFTDFSAPELISIGLVYEDAHHALEDARTLRADWIARRCYAGQADR